jgi:hypothetical protein
VHPFYDLARALDAGHITREEYRRRADLLRITDPVTIETYIQQHFGQETGVPSAILAPIVNRKLEMLDAERNWRDDERETTINIHEMISERMAMKLNCSQAAAIKALYRVRNEDSELVHIRIADAVLLALDLTFWELDLPFLPGKPEGAREQVSAYLDATGTEMSQMEEWQLSRDLYNFTRGFAAGGLITGDKIAHKRREFKDGWNTDKLAKKTAVRGW